jgi:hypothetical protein
MLIIIEIYLYKELQKNIQETCLYSKVLKFNQKMLYQKFDINLLIKEMI